MKTLKNAPFLFENEFLCQVYREIYQDQMVIVTNMKPLISEVENKSERKPRSIHYIRIQLSTDDQI